MTPEERAESVLWGGSPLPAETREQIAAAVRAAVLEEQERCARIADEGEEMEGRSGQGESGWVACRIREGTP